MTEWKEWVFKVKRKPLCSDRPSSIILESCLRGPAHYNLSTYSVEQKQRVFFPLVLDSWLVDQARHWSICCASGQQTGGRERPGDNDSHCSFGWGVEAWQMTHREEWRREKQREWIEGGLECFEEIKVRSEKRKGVWEPPWLRLRVWSPSSLSPESALTSSSSSLFRLLRLCSNLLVFWHLSLSYAVPFTPGAPVDGRKPSCDQTWQIVAFHCCRGARAFLIN